MEDFAGIVERGRPCPKWSQRRGFNERAYLKDAQATVEQYQRVAPEWDQDVSERFGAASERAISELERAASKQLAPILVAIFEYLREIFEEVRAAFEVFRVFRVAFERPPSLRLNPPSVLLRVVGPVSMDLRPFHREKLLEGNSLLSMGSVFLENLTWDTWTPWNLRSYVALVAAKLIRKGPPYPPAFTSDLSLLVKRLVKANPQLAFQLNAKKRRRHALKTPVESTGLDVSAALTSRVDNDDAPIKGAVEGALIQRCLSAMINLGVRDLTSDLTRIGKWPKFSGGFRRYFEGAAQSLECKGHLSF